MKNSIPEQKKAVDTEKKQEAEEEEGDEERKRKQIDPKVLEERVRRFYNHKAHPLFPKPSKEIQEKLVSMSLDLNENGKDFYESKYYQDLFKCAGDKWAFNPLQLKNATVEQHEELVANFRIPDDNHKYSPDINEALNLFQKWRKYRNKKEWKYEKTANKIKMYSHECSQTGLTIVKAESAVSYSTPIILGILLHPVGHKYNKKNVERKMELIEPLSLYSFALRLNIKTPFFVGDRELCVITFLYTFRDGSIIFGSRSIDHKKYPIQKKSIRAQINLNLYHIRPRYGKSLQSSKISLYVQMDLRGSIPKSVTTQIEKSIPNDIFQLATYLTQNEEKLSIPGLLHIPPYPVLKNLGVDIGWMDRDNIDDEKKQSFSIQTRDYIFKKIAAENEKNSKKIICLDQDFNDISFDFISLKQELKEKIYRVIQIGNDEKKDVTISVVVGANTVCDAAIKDEK